MLKKISAVFSLFMLGMLNAVAAVPTAVSDELTTAKADVATIGGLVFAVVVAIVIFKWFRRSL